MFFNTNLDPTRRYGSETSASLRVSDTVLLRGGVAYTRAVFREGPFAGNDVPLVSRYTASAGVTWNIWQNYLVVDATRARLERALHGQRPGQHPALIPANATVDLKLSGAYDRFFWSLSVNNLFNALYYDYAIASTFTPGRFCGLSAARPDLHGEGRRDVLTGRPAGSADLRMPARHHLTTVPIFDKKLGRFRPKITSSGAPIRGKPPRGRSTISVVISEV